MSPLTKNQNNNTTALNADNTVTGAPQTGTAPLTQPAGNAYNDQRYAEQNPYPTSQVQQSGPNHGFNNGPPLGANTTTQPSQGQYGREPLHQGFGHGAFAAGGGVGQTQQDGTQINQGQYPQSSGNPNYGAHAVTGHPQRVGDPAMPSTNVVGQDYGSTTTTGCGGPSLQGTVGKVETAIGHVIGSNSLKAKGLQKEHDANSKKIQGVEITEAERLEQEALMRRERAVGHGAHPAHSALGGHGGPRANN